MKSNLKIPIYAINPLYGIIIFDWFVFLLKSIIKDNLINIYVIHNPAYKDIRKEDGPFLAKLSKKRIVDTIMNVKDVMVIGDYDMIKIFVVSTQDITEDLQEAFSKINIDITMGATASVENDTEFSILDRAIKAISLAQSKNINFQRL